MEALKISEEQNAEGIKYALRAMLMRPDFNAVLSSFPGKVLYISGVHDAILELEAQKNQVAQCQKGQHLILESTGHMGMFEEPETCRKAVLDFLLSR